MTGDSALDLLAKGCPLDLKALGDGQCASSLLGDVPIVYDRCGDGFELYIPRTYAQFAWEWLIDAAGEFGYAARLPQGGQA